MPAVMLIKCNTYIIYRPSPHAITTPHIAPRQTLPSPTPSSLSDGSASIHALNKTKRMCYSLSASDHEIVLEKSMCFPQPFKLTYSRCSTTAWHTAKFASFSANCYTISISPSVLKAQPGLTRKYIFFGISRRSW